MLKKIKKIPVLIVEDNQRARDFLKILLSEHDDIEVLAGVDNTKDAWALINKGNVNVQGIFLDINIFGETDRAGIDFAYQLEQLPSHKQPWIVFVTGYEEHALEAHRFNKVIHYLMKPLNSDKIQESLTKVQQRYTPSIPAHSQRRLISYKRAGDNGTTHNAEKNCQLEDIIYLKSFFDSSGNIKIKLINNEELLAKNVILNNWEKEYAVFFLRIHKSTLVNRQHARDGGYFIENGRYFATPYGCQDSLLISDTYLDQFLNLFKE